MERITAIRYELQDIAKAEAVRVWRLARRMESHGCDPESISRARAEADELYNTMGWGYPERLLNPFKVWQYAFK